VLKFFTLILDDATFCYNEIIINHVRTFLFLTQFLLFGESEPKSSWEIVHNRQETSGVPFRDKTTVKTRKTMPLSERKGLIPDTASFMNECLQSREGAQLISNTNDFVGERRHGNKEVTEWK
jgi:hypothetical protein